MDKFSCLWSENTDWKQKSNSEKQNIFSMWRNKMLTKTIIIWMSFWSWVASWPSNWLPWTELYWMKRLNNNRSIVKQTSVRWQSFIFGLRAFVELLLFTHKKSRATQAKNDHFSIHYIWTESSRAFILNCNENKDDQIERRLYWGLQRI